MINTTPAAILVAQGQPLVVDEIELPSSLRFGQVLVRVAFSGICGSQLGEIDGAKGPDPHLPHLLGHEGGGVVEAIGEGVSTVKPNDRVVLHWRPGDGLHADPPVYRWRDQPLNAGWVTTFNRHAVVSEDRVTALPSDFPLDLAALLGCAVTTAFGVMANDAALLPGESVLILGVGGVGLAMVQAAALSAAHPIIAVDRHASRLHLAHELGATHAIQATNAGIESSLRELIGPDGADVCIDNTGDAGLIELAIALTGARGRTVLVGVPARDHEVKLHTLQLHFGKRLTGSHGGSAQPARDIPRLARLVSTGGLDLAPLITDRAPLAEVNQAIQAIRTGDVAGKCLLELSPER